MPRKPSPIQGLQHLPRHWAVAILAVIILYVVVQPIANRQFGWKLPSLPTITGNASPETLQRPNDSFRTPASPKPTRTQTEALTPEAAQGSAQSESNSEIGGGGSEPTQGSSAPQDDTRSANNPSPGKTSEARRSESLPVSEDSSLKFGILKETGNEVYVSPAGLRYTRGSEEGHRLKHIERHLKDDPKRPGKHGVFEGDMPQVLRWIDDAYTRGKQSAKDVRKYEDEGRTIYEATFAKPIGYVGGRDGGRAKNPEAKRLRLVLDGDRVITAFPF